MPANRGPDPVPAPAKTKTRRMRAETRFKYFGLAAVVLALTFLVLLLITIISQGYPAFRHHYATLEVDLGPEFVDPADPDAGDYRAGFRAGVKKVLPFAAGRRDGRTARALFSAGAGFEIRTQVLDDPALLGAVRKLSIPLSDYADLYLKDLVGKGDLTRPDYHVSVEEVGGAVRVNATSAVFAPFLSKIKELLANDAARIAKDIASTKSLLERLAGGSATKNAQNIELLQLRLAEQQAAHGKLLAQVKDSASPEKLSGGQPSLLVHLNGAILKAEEVGADFVTGAYLVPGQSAGVVSAGNWFYRSIEEVAAARKFTDKEIAYVEYLRAADLIESGWNISFFTKGASREPETAGIWGAAVGSFFTLIVTLALSFPIGVAAGIYLEAFAPKNWITSLIEVNINNLAAVPSIVFGLLGLALFINGIHFNFFGLFEISLGGGMPRSAPVVGGMVLALMTLPTIIIASRAALKAVPPSIREAALAVGASNLQAVFHHVLPLAMPGILTGTIIGMAQALGETAPLLMIGMVAFIVDVPGWFSDPATVLPVQIYMWADFPEPAFRQKTAAAIMVLLGFLAAMNLIAVLLRRKFERRW